jgi:hypothetical protein
MVCENPRTADHKPVYPSDRNRKAEMEFGSLPAVMEISRFNLHSIIIGGLMKFWVVTGFVAGFVILSFISRRCRAEEYFLQNPEKCYDIEDLITEQEL